MENLGLDEVLKIALTVIGFFVAKTLSEIQSNMGKLNTTMSLVVTDAAVIKSTVEYHGRVLDAHGREISDLRDRVKS